MYNFLNISYPDLRRRKPLPSFYDLLFTHNMVVKFGLRKL